MFIILEKESASIYARLFEVISDQDDVIDELLEAGFAEITRCHKRDASDWLNDYFEKHNLDPEYQHVNYRKW